MKNIDTDIKIDIVKSGINDTFSKGRDYVKNSTCNVIHSIIKEGIYLETTRTPGDVNDIKYHHFLTAVRLNGTDNNVCIRTVMREFPNDATKSISFYYHQFEKLDNKKRNISTWPK